MERKLTYAELQEKVRLLEENPRFESFKAALVQIKFWDAEIAAQPISIRDSTEEDTRLFDKILKYQMERQRLLDSLEKDRQLLDPKDVASIEKEATSMVDTIRQRVKNEIENRDSADN